MKKTIKEFVASTGFSRPTVEKIFKAAGLVLNGDRKNPVRLGEKEFEAVVKKLKIRAYCGAKRSTKNTLPSILFSLATKIAREKYGTIKNFCEQTGFERSRWYVFSEGYGFQLRDNEAEILRELLNV